MLPSSPGAPTTTPSSASAQTTGTRQEADQARRRTARAVTATHTSPASTLPTSRPVASVGARYQVQAT